ncbi:MAG TPA: N-acetyl-gamma-glutamyl-phosphate reductase [Candidatus Binatia bacterium]|nr:N-acetyl-gamma-glutamyl-phosphate reductase [Candidatus Binatia bacterium]
MPVPPVRAAVCGATGYQGAQCVHLLQRHPGIELVRVLGRSSAGQVYAEAVPGSRLQLVVEDGMDPGDADVVFAALPHTVTASVARDWLSSGKVVVDLSADFRLRDPAAYTRWYGLEHPAPDLCEEAVYSLVEIHRESIPGADLLAVPGCYPTASLLATVPALREGLVEPEVIVDAKSGVSGAGRSPALAYHFPEVNESVKAYGVAGHRHKSEMLQELRAAAGAEVRLTFVPHLVPMSRGILATAYLHPVIGRGVADVAELMRGFCAANPFLRYQEAPPATKSVTGSNVAAVNVTDQEGIAVVTVAEDNLIKGGAGQAVQAANLRFGLGETAGLPGSSMWP